MDRLVGDSQRNEAAESVEDASGPPLSRLDYAKALTAELLSEIAQLVGVEAALVIARRFGGRRLYIPRRPGDGHKIVRCIGREGARRLGAALGGEGFIIPCARSYLRWLDARALRILGLSNAEIAERIGVNERHVRRLLHGFRPERYAADETVRAIGRLYGVEGG
jgi:hypothetical protein